MNQNKHYVGYLIKLEEEDIVVCLPINCPIGASFRIDTSVREATNSDSFVYFMYYDPTRTNGYKEYEKETWGGIKYDYSTSPPTPIVKSTYTGADACLYYMDSVDALNAIRTSDNQIYNIDADGVDASTTQTTGGAGKGAIWMGSQNSPTKEVIVGTLDAVGPADIVANFQHDHFDDLTGDNVIMYLVPNDVGFTFLKGSNSGGYDAAAYTAWNGNGSKAWRSQGLIYGINSNLKLGMFESDPGAQIGLFGQIKGLSVNFMGDQKSNHRDSPMGVGSLLDYVGVKNNFNSSKPVVKLMYYQY